MAEPDTLLAYLVPKLTNRVEDAATDALAFILNKSKACLGALNGLLQDGDFQPEPIATVKTQVTYQEDGSRPDMAGYDREGVKRLLVETKFWASLGQRQASGYFEQLEAIGPGVLLFVAPDSRVETLWTEIKRQMNSGEGDVRLDPMWTTDRIRKAKITGSDKRVMLVSWDRLLGSLATAVADDTRVACDIQQLRGLASYQDEEAFLPIHPEEFGPALPRRIQGLYHLIGDVIDRGVREDWIINPRWEGYGRYFKFKFAGVKGRPNLDDRLGLFVNFPRWATNADTPLWLWIGTGVPISIARLSEGIPSLIRSEGLGTDVPIYLPTGAEYESVVDEVARQIGAIANMIDAP